jgi:hypothetical protein
MSEFERKPGESDLQHAARINQGVDGEIGHQPVSRPTILHIVADTMKIREAAHFMCNTIYTKKGVHPEHKIRLEAKDLTAILSAAIHKYLHDNDVNV